LKKYILISLIIAFGFSFSFFLFFQQENWETLNPSIDNFYLQTSQEYNPKILLIGSSHIGMLNSSYINSIIDEKYPDYLVYNLAISSDRPVKRIHEIEKITSLNPKVIVYGVGLRDFSNKQSIPTILPDPQNFVNNYFSENTPQFLENPKLVTLNVIKNNLQYENKPKNLEKNTPFFPYDSDYNQITNLDELEQKANSDLSINISNIETNKDFIALKEILSTFTKNHIKTVIILTPHNSYFLDSLSDSDKENFSKIINEISLDKNLKVNSLMNNYSNINIWVSENHITHGLKGLQFNNDVGKIILSVLEK